MSKAGTPPVGLARRPVRRSAQREGASPPARRREASRASAAEGATCPPRSSQRKRGVSETSTVITGTPASRGARHEAAEVFAAGRRGDAGHRGAGGAEAEGGGGEVMRACPPKRASAKAGHPGARAQREPGEGSARLAV